jgi:hypothetical protein
MINRTKKYYEKHPNTPLCKFGCCKLGKFVNYKKKIVIEVKECELWED